MAKQKARFKDLRELKGITVEKLCARAGISDTTLYRLESGKAVSPLTVGKACRALGVKPGDLEGIVMTSDVVVPPEYSPVLPVAEEA